jgi:hypothetical protein
MQGRYSRISTAFVLIVGVILGWSLSLFRPAPLYAGGGDRAGETIVTTGSVLVQYDNATQSPVSLDAVYILDYKGGRLIATVPTFRQSASSTTIIDAFAERDLAADFKLDLDAGKDRPHFLMTTGALGRSTAGWAPLYVVETTSNQVGVYKLHLQGSSGKSSRPRFERLQLISYAKGDVTPAPSS